MPRDEKIVRFPVFHDVCGNRFVFPAINDHNDVISPTERWEWCRRAELALSIKEEEKNFETALDDRGYMNFTHVVTTAGSPGFEHGSEIVWLVGGPEFDSTIARGASE